MSFLLELYQNADFRNRTKLKNRKISNSQILTPIILLKRSFYYFWVSIMMSTYLPINFKAIPRILLVKFWFERGSFNQHFSWWQLSISNFFLIFSFSGLVVIMVHQSRKNTQIMLRCVEIDHQRPTKTQILHFWHFYEK